MRVFYNFFILLFKGAIFFLSFFNQKVKDKYIGSKTWQTQIKNIKKSDEVVWFHASSLGEFEQGRPLIEKLKKEQPTYKILLSFFSPSGFKVQKDYPFANDVIYLPFDTIPESKKITALFNLKLVVFVKYDYWFNLMNQLYVKNIPFVFISSVFRENQYFFKPWGKWFKNQLKQTNYFFVQDEKSKQLLSQFGINKTTVSGDTRFDRVREIAEKKQAVDIIKEFKGNSLLLVAGSTWKKDDELIISLIKKIKNKDVKYLIAPHQIEEKQMSWIENTLADECIRFSNCSTETTALLASKVMLLDTIGMLSNVYQYADIAYIGGGFGLNIHNILEPAVFGVPVFFGPKHQKFLEAQEIKSVVNNCTKETPEALEKEIFTIISDDSKRQAIGLKIKDYIWGKQWATEVIYTNLKNYLRQNS